MNRVTRDGMAEPVSRDQILRRERGQQNVHFPCSADHEQDWQPYPVDPLLYVTTIHAHIIHPCYVNKNCLYYLICREKIDIKAIA